MPYLIGSALTETSWDIRRRILVARVIPSIFSLGVPVLVSAILLHRKNRTLVAIFWTLGTLSSGMFVLSPIFEILWEQKLLWNKNVNWGKTVWQDPKYFFVHFQMFLFLQPRWKWLVRGLAILAGAGITIAFRSKLSIDLPTSKKGYKFIWLFLLGYLFCTIFLALFAIGRNTLQSIRELRKVPIDGPCPQLWRDPLFIPSF